MPTITLRRGAELGELQAALYAAAELGILLEAWGKGLPDGNPVVVDKRVLGPVVRALENWERVSSAVLDVKGDEAEQAPEEELDVESRIAELAAVAPPAPPEESPTEARTRHLRLGGTPPPDDDDPTGALERPFERPPE